MDEIKIRVYSKINLALDIKGVFDDGYHILDMLVTSADIYDTVKVSKNEKIEVYMDRVIQDSSNTATKAAELLTLAYGYPIKVEIEKGIPMKAGLGGSSADAAAVFFCYSKLFDIDLYYMHQLAMNVGSDVVYMITGGPAKVKCRGEMVFPFEDIQLNLVVAQKEYGAETGQVYKEYDKNPGDRIEPIVISDKISSFNVLEPAAERLCPAITEAKNDLLQYTNKVFMTGSGSAVVGVFDTLQEAQECANKLDNYLYKAAVTTQAAGIKILEEK